MCRECGKPLEPGFDFCSWCGAMSQPGASSPEPPPMSQSQVPGGQTFPAYNEDLHRALADRVHQMTVVMLTIWVFMSTLEGTPMLLFPEQMSEYLGSIGGLPVGASLDATADQIRTQGLILVVSGLLALGSALLCWKRLAWKGALALCMGSAITMFAPIFALGDNTSFFYALCGFIVAFRIRQSRNLFKS